MSKKFTPKKTLTFYCYTFILIYFLFHIEMNIETDKKNGLKQLLIQIHSIENKNENQDFLFT